MTHIQPILLKNSRLRSILKNCPPTPKRLISKAKGFELSNYQNVLTTYTSDLDYAKISALKKVSCNFIFGETKFGKYFKRNLRHLLYKDFYSSGYHPFGFAGWHNDADVIGYHLMFSYSAKGRGCLKYFNKSKNKIVVFNDIKGWQLKTLIVKKDSAPYHCLISPSSRYTFILSYKSRIQFSKALNKITK